ncbi:MAG: hypothetical protein WD100_05930 [Tistlia sp.]|uniref:hypothetical protein n=1 Tax=Tistlia sp. TaxID=3057121 RepID=UPI0034A3A419
MLRGRLALVLVFIGGTIFVADLLGLAKIPPVWSLSITVTILTLGVLISLLRTARPQAEPVAEARSDPGATA